MQINKEKFQEFEAILAKLELDGGAMRWQEVCTNLFEALKKLRDSLKED